MSPYYQTIARAMWVWEEVQLYSEEREVDIVGGVALGGVRPVQSVGFALGRLHSSAVDSSS